MNPNRISRRDVLKLGVGVGLTGLLIGPACALLGGPPTPVPVAERLAQQGTGAGTLGTLGSGGSTEALLQLNEIQLTWQKIEWRTGDGQTVVNEGNFLPMTETATGDGKIWVPSDAKIRDRLATLHDQYEPEQVGIWSQPTQDIVEATAGDEAQYFVLLQLWNPGWRGNQTAPHEEWTTLLFPGDSVHGESLAGTAWAYESNRNGDGSYKDGWTNEDFAADVLAGIARRARFTKIADVDMSLQFGQPAAKGLIALNQVLRNGWMQSRVQR